MATRAASGKALNALSGHLPELIGGSADLTPSNDTWLNGQTEFENGSPLGRIFHFGVREHGMGGIINGMALHGGIRPFGGTFLIFSDYMRGAIRISALSHVSSLWIFTHDSIGLGEDGPTHQPIEHIASLRAIPNLVVLRPCDANETVEAWKYAIQNQDGPRALLLTRQAVPTLDRTIYAPASDLVRGAYVLADMGDKDPDIILMASGSEVRLIVAAASNLAAEGINVRIVSFPSWELFDMQDKEYQEAVLPDKVHARLAVEAGVPQGWEKYTGPGGVILGIDQFGASAPGEVVLKEFGFTVERVIQKARELL